MQRITNRVLDKFPLRPPVKLTEGMGNNYITNIKRVYYIFYFSEIQNLWNIRLPTKDCVQNIRTIKKEKKTNNTKILPHFNTAKFIKLTIFHGWFTLGKLILFPSFHFWFPSLRYWTQFPLTVGYWIWDPLNCTKWNKKKLCGDTLATLSTYVLNKFKALENCVFWVQMLLPAFFCTLL